MATKTKIQFATRKDFENTATMVEEMNTPEWNTTISYDEESRVITFDGMDEEDVMYGCFCLRTCLTTKQAWVVE